MTRIRIGGVVLFALLGAGLFVRIINRADAPPKKSAGVPLEVRAVEGQPVIESVDLRNGNVHVEIPIRAARQKTAVPRSGH